MLHSGFLNNKIIEVQEVAENSWDQFCTISPDDFDCFQDFFQKLLSSVQPISQNQLIINSAKD